MIRLHTFTKQHGRLCDVGLNRWSSYRTGNATTLTIEPRTVYRNSLGLIIVALILVMTYLFTALGPLVFALPNNYDWQKTGKAGLNGDAVNWSGTASSLDGTKLVAIVKGGAIYTSIDSGLTG